MSSTFDTVVDTLAIDAPFDVLDAVTWDTGRVWPNFGPVHDERSARRTYDEPTRRRLAAIVRAYDPDGVLHLGRWTRTFE